MSAKRPFVTWSIVIACLAARIGWIVGTCDVEKTPDPEKPDQKETKEETFNSRQAIWLGMGLPHA